MIAVKDLESLKHIAARLFIPFFAAALLSDGGIGFLNDQTLQVGVNSPVFAIKIASWTIGFMMAVAVVAFATLIIDQSVIWIHVRTGDKIVMPWVGFASLTCGLFIFSNVFPNMPKSPLNPFWHLGFLAYGTTLIDRAAK